jgi:nucleoid-associated protein YgaU
VIYQSSRYYNQLIDYIALYENADELPIVFYEFDNPGTTTWVEHIYSQGERLDQLSFKYYGRPDFWWVIPEYNQAIEDFNNIPAGTVLRIPRV